MQQPVVDGQRQSQLVEESLCAHLSSPASSLGRPCDFDSMAAARLLAVIALFVALVTPSLQVVSSCCRGASGSCKKKCEQLSRDILSTEPETEERRALADIITEACPLSLTFIWSCINSSLEAVDAGGPWLGRKCCSLSRIPDCQTACLTAKGLADLNSACRQSYNIELFQCVNTIEEGDVCCSNATSGHCKRNCMSLFIAAATSSTTSNPLP